MTLLKIARDKQHRRGNSGFSPHPPFTARRCRGIIDRVGKIDRHSVWDNQIVGTVGLEASQADGVPKPRAPRTGKRRFEK